MNTLLDTMITAAIAAADEIMAVYAMPFATITKADGSPVTLADARAEAVILKHLAPLGIPVLAEESAAEGRIPQLGRRYFAVDPLDGTKEFIKRNGEFTVNIGLIEDHRPVFGVVLAPATGAGWYGGPNFGAFAFEVEAGRAGDARPINTAPDGPLRLVASRSHGRAELAQLAAEMNVTEDVTVGSSLKLCMLASGAARLYPRFGPTWEWDTAAGQAILEAAGGALLRVDGTPLDYDRAANHLNPDFAAASDAALAAEVARSMQRLLA